MTCKAIQQSDEMFCAQCNLRWDMNDPEPPLCGLQSSIKPLSWPGAEVLDDKPKMVKYEVHVTRRMEKMLTIEVPAGTPDAEMFDMGREAAELYEWTEEPDFEARYVDRIEEVEP